MRQSSELSLNPTKTGIMLLGSRYLLSKVAISEVEVLGSSIAVVETVHNLGEVMDSCLTMADHVSATCRAS